MPHTRPAASASTPAPLFTSTVTGLCAEILSEFPSHNNVCSLFVLGSPWHSSVSAIFAVRPVLVTEGPTTFARVAGPTNGLARFANEAYNSNFGSYHPGICQFVFCDGRVRALQVQIDGVNLARMVNRKDGEPITAASW